jgi:hypothetical protein
MALPCTEDARWTERSGRHSLKALGNEIRIHG